MYHSITFGDGTLDKNGNFIGTNTWDDWHLIPSSRPVIASPGVSTKFIEIPGKSGMIDLSEYLTGDVVYGNRSGSLEFYVDNGHEYWESIRSKIANFLHGQKMCMCLEDDPTFYWEGRFSLNEWRSESWNSMVVIDYNVGPFKISIHENDVAPVLWDTFNFNTDYDWYTLLHKRTVVNQTLNIYIYAQRYPFELKATLEGSGEVDVTFGGVMKKLTINGQSETLGSASYGKNKLTIKGTGTVSFSFRGGSL